MTRPILASLLASTLLAAPMVTVPAQAETDPLDLVEPIADYKAYVLAETGKLVDDTRAFTDAIKAGDLEKAKALYAPSRVSYERIEPIAELFSDLDVSIDSRADDHEQAEASEDFTGFHRLEYGLFAQDTTDGLGPIADKLMTDVEDLESRISDLTLPPQAVVGGAAVLMEEVAASKVSGEEDRYSRTDLWDFQANVDGAQKIVELFAPQVKAEDPELLADVQGNLEDVNATLAKYRDGEGFVSYEKLDDQDRRRLAAEVNTLAEDLSMFRGTLGLD